MNRWNLLLTPTRCEMNEIQFDLFGHEMPSDSQKIVNVASVPMRSPFRYPGGKTWLVPRIRDWLASLSRSPALFLEPFAGGAIVGLTVGFENLADQVVLVELDENVGAVWQSVINDGDGPWLADRIISFAFDYDSVVHELGLEALTTRDRAWKTILKNRVQRGGILAPGAGLVRYGEEGKGLSSRWYPHTLARRILAIDMIRHRFRFVQGDGLQEMRNYLGRTEVAIFADPPYTAGGNGKRAGTRLYSHSEIDHEELFSLAQRASSDILVTYDNDPEVQALARRHSLTFATVPMKNTHHATMTELLISRDLEWVSNGGKSQQ